MMKSLTHPIGNFVLFQLCWFANVLSASAGWPEIGVTLTALWIALHLSSIDEGRGTESLLLIAAAVFGYTADSLLVLLGLIEFPEHARLGGPSPLWMVALWVAFAATFLHALRWLKDRYLLAALLGALGGPLAYRAGEALGAIAIPDAIPGLIAVGVEWLIAMPILLGVVAFLSNRSATEVRSDRNQTEPNC